MFSLFTRNYVGAFIGMLFFGTMFFVNIDMILQNKSILTESGVPNFIGWLTPFVLFLYFGVFFLLYNRFLYGCKNVKKSLQLLLLIVAILYGLGSIILLWFILSGYTQGILYMGIMVLLSFKNFYFYTKVKHKEFFTKIKNREFFKYISVYGMIIISALIIYIRPLSDINYPKNYFNINIKTLSNIDNKIDVTGHIQATDYIKKIANKDDPNADYGVIIYNLPKETVAELHTIYEATKNMPKFITNFNYSYKNFITIQKINLLKFEYEVLHNDYISATETMSQVLKMNQQILVTSHDLNDFASYIDLQNITMTTLIKYIQGFSAQQIAILNIEVSDMDMKKTWKDALENDFNHRLASLSDLYSIPLFIDKDEMLYVSLYNEYLKSENLISAINEVHYKSIFRKNYLGLSLLENTVPDFDSAFKKLSELNTNVSNFKKNTLN